jgi:bifunctional non-homologous end joining protein LigD
MQIHKAGRKVTPFTRKGHDWPTRFSILAAELRALPTCILDAEVVAAHAHGAADFRRLHRTVSKRQEEGLAFWAFDLLFARRRALHVIGAAIGTILCHTI